MTAPNLKGKKLVIWDFDETIVHLSVDWLGARKVLYDYLNKNHGLDFQEHERTLQHMEYKAVQKIDDPKEIKKIYKIRHEFESADLSGSRIIDHALNLLVSLRGKGIKHAICSNNLRKTVEHFVEVLDLKDDIEFIVAIDDVRIPKPDPKGCKMILDHFKISPEEVLFIGDNPATDGQAAESLGIEFLHVDEI